jgi:peptidoglycan/LPS O-acetylase OafA/YrhL
MRKEPYTVASFPEARKALISVGVGGPSPLQRQIAEVVTPRAFANHAGMSKPDLIRPLHGLRGLAAMSVFIGHFWFARFNPSLGVVLFYVLSGYLIARLYLERPFSGSEVRDYAIARIARVYPLFATVIVGTALLNSSSPASVYELSLTDVVPHLLLAGSNKTVWTVSVEFQFYLLFIAFWWLRARGFMKWWLLLTVMAAAVCVGLLYGPDLGRIALPRYLFIFLCGAGIAHFTRRPTPALDRVCGALLPIALIAYVALGIGYPKASIYASPAATVCCTALVLASACAPASRTGRLLSGGVPFWLGEVSFGIYLLHAFGQIAALDLFGKEGPRLAIVALATALTLTGAAVAHVVVERPARAYLRRFGQGWGHGPLVQRG